MKFSNAVNLAVHVHDADRSLQSSVSSGERVADGVPIRQPSREGKRVALLAITPLVDAWLGHIPRLVNGSSDPIAGRVAGKGNFGKRSAHVP